MPQMAQKLIGKVGMALGIVVLVGSVVGGAVLAADLSRAGDQADDGVPVSNAVTPSDLGAASGSASSAAPTDPPAVVPTPPPADAGGGSPPGGPAATPTPQPSPTCWLGTGERPDGIEKCEDDEAVG